MSKKSCIKICERCGKEFEASSGYVHFCNECLIIIKQEKRERNNQARLIAKQTKLLKGVEGVDYVIDLWNGLPTTRITGRWFNERHPGRTIEEYKKEFPNAQLVCSSTSKKISDNTKEHMSRPEMKKHFSEMFSGDKNPNAKCNTTEEYRKSLSPFSKSFKGYEGLSEEEKEEKIRKNLKYDKIGRTPNQIEYWINRGYNEEEAKLLVSERQKTFTLEKCIKKYGEEEGLKRWKERQLKWQENYKHLNYSKISQELFWNIYFKLNDKCFFAQNDNGMMDNSGKNHEKRVLTSNTSVSLDFYYPKTNTIIEFDGDYWHSDTREYVNKHRDIERDNSLKKAGYNKILHIKESEYNKDKEGTIQKCIDFLKGD